MTTSSLTIKPIKISSPRLPVIHDCDFCKQPAIALYEEREVGAYLQTCYMKEHHMACFDLLTAIAERPQEFDIEGTYGKKEKKNTTTTTT